jgi:hypothetical protein
VSCDGAANAKTRDGCGWYPSEGLRSGGVGRGDPWRLGRLTDVAEGETERHEGPVDLGAVEPVGQDGPPWTAKRSREA